MMQVLSIIWPTLIFAGSIIGAYGAEEKESISSSTVVPDYNSNEDYPDNYDDYQNRDYPNPDYYEPMPDREGRGRSLPDEGQDTMSEGQYLKQLQSTIPGIPGVDYPLYQTVPDTSFQCQNQRYPGFYGDVESQCQVFHICQEDDRHDSFLCPVGTVFNQMNFICDWWFNFKCDETPTFFHLNAQFHTSSGATPSSAMINKMQQFRATDMKKMRRFRYARKYKPSVMKISMKDTDHDFENELKRMYMNNPKIMTEMERQRIMNLFSTKIRPLNFWKRLQATTITDDNRKYSPTSVTDPIRNDDFKLLASTNYLEFKNSEYSTTSLITTDANIDPLTSSHAPDTISKPMDIMNVQNSTENITASKSTSGIVFDHNEIETEAIPLTTSSAKKAAVDDNEIFVSITIPTTTTIGIHSISENATSNSSQTDNNENLFLTDLNFSNKSTLLKTSPRQYIENEMDLVDDTDSQTDNKLNELSIKVTPTPISSTPSQLTLNFNPILNNNSIATIGNGTHVSVSVTVRATAGISRLKWRRIPHGKKRKNLRLKNAPADMDFTNNQDSYMDIIFRKRPMRNKKLRSRIMWVPSKNSTLNRRSHWRIFLNSRPQNVTSLYKINEGNQQMPKMELIKDIIFPILVKTKDSEGEKNSELNAVQNDDETLSTHTDSSNETFMTESTKLFYTLMSASEPTAWNASIIPEIVVTTVNDTAYQNLESLQNSTDFDEIKNCETICLKLLKSLGIGNKDLNYEDVSMIEDASEPSLTTTNYQYTPNDTIVNSSQFGRRSFLEISPSDQWTIKYDPDPDCNDDKDNDKILVRGWSVIIDSGSVTKEKTVKRRGCQNVFDDSKIIVMQNMLPDHETIPDENKHNNKLDGTNESKISFGSMDQQYWLNLVKNWLEASPKPRNGPDFGQEWIGDKKSPKRHVGIKNTNKAKWMEADSSGNEDWSRDLKDQKRRNRVNNQNNRDLQMQYFNEQKKLPNLDDDSYNQGFNKNPRFSWMENNYRDWRNNIKQNSWNSKRQTDEFHKKVTSNARIKPNRNSNWQQDVWSSQSDRKEWHINLRRMDEKGTNQGNEQRNNFDGGRRNWSFKENDKSNISPQKWPKTSRDENNAFISESGTRDWSSEVNDFSEIRSGDWSGNQEKKINAKKKTKRHQDEWFMSSEENKRFSQPQGDKPVWSDDEFDRDTMPARNLKGTDNSRSTKTGFSDDLPNQNTWSSGSPNKPWSSTNQQKDENFDFNQKDSSSDDRDENKGYGSKGSWSSGRNNRNKGFVPQSKEDSWASSDRNFQSDEARSDNSDWSSKTRDSRKDWPSFKGRSRDDKDSFGNTDRSRSRQNQGAWSSDNRNSKTFPPLGNGNIWSMDEQKRDWNSRTDENKDDWSSNKRTNNNFWASNDQQIQTDLPNIKGDWSSGRRSNGNKQRGQFDDSVKKTKNTPGKNIKGIDNTRPAPSGRNKWTQDTQKDISDWPMNDKQPRKNDWSSKNQDNSPSWSSDLARGPDVKASESRKSDDDWFNDKTMDESRWPSDVRTDNKNQWNRNKKLDGQGDSSGWSVDDRQSRSDVPNVQDRWDFSNQKDVSNDDINSNDWQSKSKGTNSNWSDSKGSTKTQVQGTFKGNKPSSTQSQNSWDNNNPQNPRQWKMEPPKADWSSTPPDQKGRSIKTKDRRRSDWSDDKIPSGDRDVDWSRDTASKPGPMIRMRNDGPWSDPKGNDDEDWPSDNVGNSKWSSESDNRRKGSDSAWDQDLPSQTNGKGDSTSSLWNSKGRTKTAMVMPNTSKGTAGMMPSKPWRDDSDQLNPMKNIKGDAMMKEEKIVWSVQISSNGETGSGWVPITLRPNIKGRNNQTRDQNNNKGAPKNVGGWSDVKQETDSWSSKGIDKATQRPLLKMDVVTENIQPSSDMLDASDSHPFYIPIANGRYKRETRSSLQVGQFIKPRNNARTIYKVIKNGKELTETNDDDHRFYLASANILVSDNQHVKKNSTNFGNTRKLKPRTLEKREYNETIKKSVPSLIQIRKLKMANSTSGYTKKLHHDKMWDSLMQESEKKELWSSPIDDSNVPSSGWIPLFRVIKTQNSNFRNNSTKPEEKIVEVSGNKENESTIYSDANITQSNTSYSLITKESPIRNITIELPEPETRNFETENMSLVVEKLKNRLNFEQEMKIGNKTLRIIPFSDIMKQLRAKPTESSQTDSSTTPESLPLKEEWNIPIMASPKTYALKLVNDSEIDNRNQSNSWTFTKRTPQGREAWILVKGSEGENKTMPNESRISNSEKQKVKNEERSGIPYRIIVGNRTRESNEPQRSDKSRIDGSNSKHQTSYTPTKEFSFDLKNWEKDSDWTPLLRAVGSVTSKRINPSPNQSTGDG
ncbi:uncharacterized protein CDAR_84541 [Caerostris darwini]|uniref:Chitin-binding type-2 domain-containing protein n=1 Tax=Caerostris darwini TaxID=1538125 RepID=A0AAV4NQW0_9ARAC|nr:uncharacterized protein CDAR_84541 [Caerostris darwini]